MSEQVADVLAAHQRRLAEGGPCLCGTWPSAGRYLFTWNEHLAEALAPLIAERERAAAERAWNEGYRLDCIGGLTWVNPYRARGDKA